MNSHSLFGHFYFKKTSNGNLIGEFSNNNLPFIQSESADVFSANSEDKHINTENFVGTYNSTWFENNTSNDLILKIEIKANSNSKIFKLTWLENSKPKFWGEGFIVDNILIGSYRDK